MIHGFEEFGQVKGRLIISYHLFVECFSQLSFDSEVYIKSAVVADFVYTSESVVKNIRHKDDMMKSLKQGNLLKGIENKTVRILTFKKVAYFGKIDRTFPLLP